MLAGRLRAQHVVPVVQDHMVVQVQRVGVAIGEGQGRHVGQKVEVGIHHADGLGRAVVEAVARGAAGNDSLLEVVDLAAARVAVVELQAAVVADKVGVGRRKAGRVERREVQVAGCRVVLHADGVARVVRRPRVHGVGRLRTAESVGHHHVGIGRGFESGERNGDVLVGADRGARGADADVAARARKAQLHRAAGAVGLQRQVGPGRVVGQQVRAAGADGVDRVEQNGHRWVYLPWPGHEPVIVAAACCQCGRCQHAGQGGPEVDAGAVHGDPPAWL